jgi:transcriptional regulator with XRE-family HTH domain
MKTLGEKIKELREKKDISVRELARQLKVSAAFLSDVELGRRHPSDEIMRRLADGLDTTLEELQQCDARPPVQELKRLAASDPAMGFALRRVVDQGVTSKDLIEFLNKHGKRTK